MLKEIQLWILGLLIYACFAFGAGLLGIGLYDGQLLSSCGGALLLILCAGFFVLFKRAGGRASPKDPKQSWIIRWFGPY